MRLLSPWCLGCRWTLTMLMNLLRKFSLFSAFTTHTKLSSTCTEELKLSSTYLSSVVSGEYLFSINRTVPWTYLKMAQHIWFGSSTVLIGRILIFFSCSILAKISKMQNVNFTTLEKSQHHRFAHWKIARERIVNRVTHLSAVRSKLKVFSSLKPEFFTKICALASRWMDAYGYNITISTNAALRVAAACGTVWAANGACASRIISIFSALLSFANGVEHWIFSSIMFGFLCSVIIGFVVGVVFLLFLSHIYSTSSFMAFICFCPLFVRWFLCSRQSFSPYFQSFYCCWLVFTSVYYE